jgi:monovalent cation/hydrogen antiporter
VIAAVTVGIYMGWHTPELTTAVMRMQGVSVWEILTFLLNAVLFLLVGLQLPGIIDDLQGEAAGSLIGWGVLISAIVIGVRLLWTLTTPFVIRALDRRESMIARRSSWRQRMITGWAGMRGSVSLAAALAIPLRTDAGAPFPERDLIIFLAFAVILATLVGQGLTLAPLIRWSGIHDDGEDEREEVAARSRLAAAALERLDELDDADWVLDDTLERVRGMYGYRQRRFAALEDGDNMEYEERSSAYMRLMFDLLDAQREALISMRNGMEISDEVRRKVERDLDLEESRLQP